MKFKIVNTEFSITEIDGMVEKISTLDVNNIDQNILNQLIHIFNHTGNYKLLDTIAILFADINDDLALQSMINKLEILKTSNHISTLIYACSEYDCGNYIEFFSDMLIQCDYHAMLECLSVFNNIKKPINFSEKASVMNKLNQYLLGLKIDDAEYELIQEALETIEDIPTY